MSKDKSSDTAAPALNTPLPPQTNGVQIHTPDWGTGVRCCYTARVAPACLRAGPGRRRVCASEVLKSQLNLDRDIIWLNQTHSIQGIDIDSLNHNPDYAQVKNWNGNLFVGRAGDFAWSQSEDVAIAISVADCVPVALFDESKSLFGICHAGWPGLAQNIISQMLKPANFNPKHTRALIGPHICQKCFEIGQDTYQRFVDADPGNKEFMIAQARLDRRPHQQRYLCDLNAIAQAQLRRAGIDNILNENPCTRCAQDARGWCYSSYRRNRSFERITMLIWRQAHEDAH